jgi:HK97 family phage major capsid protein
MNLEQLRAEALAKANAIVEAAEAEKRMLTEAEQKQFDEHMAEVENLDKAIETRSKLAAAKAKQSAPAKRKVDANPLSDEPADLPNEQRSVRIEEKVVIPVEHRYRNGKLRSFSGQRSDEKAYIAGQFYLATLFKSERAALWLKDHGVEVRGMAGSVNSAGGVLVPDVLESAIIDLRETYGVFRQNAKVVPMTSDTSMWPRRVSGLTAYFVGEGNAEGSTNSVTASTPGMDGVKLTARKLAALSLFSSEVGEDAVISIGDFLTNEIAYAMAVKEDQCGFVGDGTSTYGGINGVVNAVAAGGIVTAASTHTGFGTITLTDFEAVIGTLPQYALANAKWYISQYGFATCMQRLLDAAGGNTMVNLQAGVQKQFLGFPVVISQVLNSTAGADASKPKAIFGDLSMGAYLGDRRGITVRQSDQRYFEYDQIGIIGTERFDINVHDVGTASVAGSVVVLKSAAS